MFNTMAEYYLEHKMGRQVTVDEAIAILSAGAGAGHPAGHGAEPGRYVQLLW